MLSIWNDTSQQRSLISSSHCKKVAKDRKAIANSHISVSESLEPAAKADSISTVTGSFFSLGFTSLLCRPSTTTLTKGKAETDSKPASQWAHDTTFTAISTTALNPVLSVKYCRYRANCIPFTGNTAISLLLSP